MPNTLSPETALEVANARAVAWRALAEDLCTILQNVVETLLPELPQLGKAISAAALPSIEKGLLMSNSEDGTNIGATDDYAGRLGAEEIAEALATETDVSDAADLPMSMRLR